MGAVLLTATPLGAEPPKVAPVEARPAAGNTLTIGWSAWASNEATTKLAAAVLSRRLGYNVKLVLADVAFLYSGLAGGKIDLFLGAWRPDAHASFLSAVAGEVDDLGILYEGARLGWLVPAAAADDLGLTAIPDLRRPDLRRRLGGRIRGGEAGSGVVELSRRALEAYGLDGYRLEPSNDAGPYLALTRAIGRGEPAVVTGRRPHWIFDAHDLRFLEDPKGVLGGRQRVHILARRGFAADHPWASTVLGRMWLPLADVSGLIAAGRARGYAAAARAYLDRHPGRVAYWVHGRF